MKYGFVAMNLLLSVRQLNGVIHRQKRPQLLEGKPIILHDNARAHTAAHVRRILDDYGWEVLPHPPYSPDLSPPDYNLFPLMKNKLRGIRFDSVDDVFLHAKTTIKQLQHNGHLNGISKLPERWEAAIEKEGDYFEC